MHLFIALSLCLVYYLDMNNEIEAMFADCNKPDIRDVLKKVGATLLKSEYDQKRHVLDLPVPDPKKWLRVRQEGDVATLSYKEAGSTMEEQKELEFVVSNYGATVELLQTIGCVLKSIQETKREKWMLDGVEVTIDTWPFLEPLLEIEGGSEEDLKSVALKLGLDYGQAIFGTVNHIYKAKYGKKIEDLSPELSRHITFSSENPFLK
jgi:adenylate cyclase, class 2